jgi:hypothetical protein
MSEGDLRLQAARWSPATKIAVPGEPEISCSKLLDDPEKAEKALSLACMAVFQGNTAIRITARGLDFLAYGTDLMRRCEAVAEAVKRAIGERPPGDPDHQAKQTEERSEEI